MSQFITIQGQCGNQIGSALWTLILHEYGIQTPESAINLLTFHKNSKKKYEKFYEAFNSFFYLPDYVDYNNYTNLSDLEASAVKARAILVDMEDSVVGRIKQGPFRNLFDQTCTVTNYLGSGNNWAVGYHTHGAAYNSQLEEAIRLSVEKCDCLHGFLLIHSLGGGTGSGLGTAVLKLLDDFYPHVDRFDSCIYPANTQDVVTSPYNVLLSTRKLIEHATCVFPAENQALQDMCNVYMNNKYENIDQMKYSTLRLPFQDMNSIIVNMLLHLTSGSRFPGCLNTDMNELATNLVPYPKLHYIFCSVSPVAFTASQTSVTNIKTFQDELFVNAWSRNNQLIKIDPLQTESLIIGTAHIYRGDASITDIRKIMKRFQDKAKFTTWSKEAMKIGLCSVPQAGRQASLICMMNSTAMSLLFKDILQNFDQLYRRKAHIHHYLQVENFEKEDFIESKETVVNVFNQYNKIQSESPTVPRLKLQ